MMKITTLIPALVFVVLALVSTAHANNAPPVVVELFTSQGCESCPPAEAYLKELGQRDDVITLEFHIDYWDYIGWRDPFADPAYTQRQKDYAAVMEARYVYTPQMIFNGKTHEVGSKRSKVASKIAALQGDINPATPEIKLTPASGGLNLRISANKDMRENYNIIMVGFDGEHVTKVTRGENRGHNLVNTNVVRSLTKIGTWNGAEINMTAPVTKGNGGCVIMLQNAQSHEILTAASMKF